jgi:hypothetical protein
VKWHGLPLEQVNIDLETHDEHSLSHLNLEELEGIEKLTWKSMEKYWLHQPPITHLHIISVAMTIADVFQNNGISVGRNLAKILNIFGKINEAKSRGVI